MIQPTTARGDNTQIQNVISKVLGLIIYDQIINDTKLKTFTISWDIGMLMTFEH